MAIRYFLTTAPVITPLRRSWRIFLPDMWAFRCRLPQALCLSLPVPVALIRFATLLLVFCFLAMTSVSTPAMTPGEGVQGGGGRPSHLRAPTPYRGDGREKRP